MRFFLRSRDILFFRANFRHVVLHINLRYHGPAIRNLLNEVLGGGPRVLSSPAVNSKPANHMEQLRGKLSGILLYNGT